MQRANRGAATADFEALYRREFPRMVALAASMCGSREVGAELAQEALLRAYRAWPKVSALDRPGAWVRRATVNLAIDSHRRRATEQTMLAQAAVETPATETTATGGFGVEDRFWVLVRSLPERQRAVVALRYVDDLSLDEIAQVLEISVGTVKSTLFSARSSLAASLGAEEV